MNLAASSNSPGSPEECLALKEAVRVRDDRIYELADKCEKQRISLDDLRGELGKAQSDKMHLTQERDVWSAKARLWEEKYRTAKQERNRLRDALTEMEKTPIVGRVAGEGYRATS